MSINSQPQKRSLFYDPSLLFLVLVNFVTIFFAVKDSWNLSTVMWIYWFQSITIGLFNFIRILQLKEFSTEGFKINGQFVLPTKHTKIRTAFFFLIHYGGFHFVYLFLIPISIFGKSSGNLDIKLIFLAALLFFVNHLFSFLYNKPRDTKKQNIGSLMFYPYVRIIPMHLTVIFGATALLALPFFLVLKTFADAVMHVVDHAVLKKGEE